MLSDLLTASSGSRRPNFPFGLNYNSPQAKGLVAWWPIISSDIKSISDRVKGLHTAPFIGSGISVKPSLVGGLALTSGGSGGAATPMHEDFNFHDYQFTLSCWIKVPNSSFNPILSGIRNDNHTGFEFAIGAVTPGVVGIWNEGLWLEGVTNVGDGKWHHIAIAFNNPSVRASFPYNIYVDGRIDNVTAPANNPTTPSSPNLNILYSLDRNSYLTGSVFDLRVYRFQPKTDADIYQMWSPRTRWELFEQPTAAFSQINVAPSVSIIPVPLFSNITVGSSMAVKNKALTITYVAWNTSSNVGQTGDAGNHTLRGVGDGTEYTPANAPTEVDATNLKGVYKLVLQASETNYLDVTIGGVSTTANVVLIPTQFQTYLPSDIATSIWQDTTSGDFSTSGSIGQSLFTGVVPGASNGHMISGTNTGPWAVTGGTALQGGVVISNSSGDALTLTTSATPHQGIQINTGHRGIQLNTSNEGIYFSSAADAIVQSNVAFNLLSGPIAANISGSLLGSVSGDVSGKVIGGGASSITGTGVQATVAAVTSGVIAADVWNAARATYVSAGSFGRSLAIVRDGTAQAGAAGTITLDSGASATNSFYNNCLVEIVGGTGIGQSRFITGYVGATKVATVNSNWVTNPDNTSVFNIIFFDAIPGATAPTAAQVATAVWQDLTAGGDFGTAGSIGKLLSTFSFDTNNFVKCDLEDIKGSASTGTAGYVGVDWGHVNAPTTTVGLTGTTIAATQQVASVSGAVGSVTAAVTVGAINSGVAAADVWNAARATYVSAGSFGRAAAIVRDGTAQAGAAGTITLDAGASATNNFYNNCLVEIVGGTGIGQSRFITGYVGSTKVATMNSNWATNPDNTSVFNIIFFDAIPGATAPTAAQVATAVWQDLTSGTDFTTSGSIGKLLATFTFDVNSYVKCDLEDIKGSASTGSAGYVGIDWSHVNAPTSTVGLTGTTFSTTQQVASVSGNISGSVASVVGNVGGSVGSVSGSVTVGTNNDKTGYALTSGEESNIAAAMLKLDFSTLSGEAKHSVLNALRKLINNFSISGSTLSVLKEDGSTVAYTQTLAATAGANPITGATTN